MTIIKKKILLSDFIKQTANMRGYIKANITDTSHFTSEQMKIVYDNILKYSYMDNYDIQNKNQNCCVKCSFTEDEYRFFWDCHGWAAYDDEIIDWFNYFKKKNDAYYQEKSINNEQKYTKVKKAYEEYLNNDVVDQKGKKSKAHFCRTSGYSQWTLSTALQYFDSKGM